MDEDLAHAHRALVPVRLFQIVCSSKGRALDIDDRFRNARKGFVGVFLFLQRSAQAVEHYEISRYGTLATWAEELGYGEAVDSL